MSDVHHAVATARHARTKPRSVADLAVHNRRSRVGHNPWKALNLRETRDRLVHDIAVRLLADMPNRESPLAIADAISLAELKVKADALRRDPATDPAVLVRMERVVELRLARLGLASRRHGRPAVRLFRP